MYQKSWSYATLPEIWQVTDVIVTFHLLGYFLPFYPPNSPKNKKIPKKWKETLEISSFYTSVPKIMIISYTVPEIRCMADVIVIFHFRLFFALLHPLPTNSPKNQISKKGKIAWRYQNFTHVYQKLWLDDVWFLRYGVWQLEGQTERQKKWHIEKGAPPKNQIHTFVHFLRYS